MPSTSRKVKSKRKIKSDQKTDSDDNVGMEANVNSNHSQQSGKTSTKRLRSVVMKVCKNDMNNAGQLENSNESELGYDDVSDSQIKNIENEEQVDDEDLETTQFMEDGELI